MFIDESISRFEPVRVARRDCVPSRKYRPLGGPAGGNGGRGGSIVFQALEGLRTLADFRGHRILVAKNGQPGKGTNKSGKNAKNLLVRVPIGTIIIRIAKPAKSSSTSSSPARKRLSRRAAKAGREIPNSPLQPIALRELPKGELGESRELTLELRLLADVGLVGLPNAGKSTLICRISTVARRSRIIHLPRCFRRWGWSDSANSQASRSPIFPG